MKAKRKKSNIFKVMEKKNQPRILYSANIFFKNKAKTKTFSDKTKGKKKIFASRPQLQETLQV